MLADTMAVMAAAGASARTQDQSLVGGASRRCSRRPRPGRPARHRGPAPRAGRGATTRRFPARIDARLVQALRARGIEQLYTHQAEAIAHALGRPQRRHRHADGVGQDALLQRAGPPEHPGGPVDARAVSVSDQGARAGSARRAASDGGARRRRGRRRHRRVHLRRRHAAGRAARDSRPRARRAEQSRTWCTPASCRTIRAGRSSSRT